MRPLNVDKEAVRVLVVAVGPREAAKQTGISESTVLQWSSRGKWLEHLKKPALEKPLSMTPRDVINVIPASQALVNSLQTLGKETRYALAKASKTGAEHAATLTGSQVLTNARSIKEIAGVASLVHGWDQAQANVHISMMGGEQPAEALEIDVEVSRVHELPDDMDDTGTQDAYDLDSY